MIIGIDLGTTNSLVSVWRNGQTELIPNALGKFITPSVVYVDDDGQVHIGEAAKYSHRLKPQLCTANFKRMMGSAQTLSLGLRHFQPEELSALILRQLKDDAERFLGEEVTEAIISVPAYFSDAQRKATQLAGELAGLKVERLINEPTAAALAYGLNDKQDESNFLVFDLGGGTFDVSILELFDGIMEVRSSAGDNFLGGEDIVDILVDAFRKQQYPLEVNWREPELQQRLREEAERVKRVFDHHTQANFSVEIDGEIKTWTLWEEDFRDLLEPFFTRIRIPLERAMRDAHLDLSSLDQVVLVGGTTRMPVIRQLVSKMFGRIPAMHLNPDEVVARGAAVQAALKMKSQDLAEVVVTDVCPYSLGVDTGKRFGKTLEHGHFSPVIDRNSSVPVSRVKDFFTAHDMQRSLKFCIYQGENRLVSNNILLGEIEVPVPPHPAGEVRATVRFTYDINGLLVVDVEVPLTGEKREVVIERHAGSLSEEEKAASLQRLNALKVHPRDQQANQALMARLDNLYQLTLNDERDWIADCAVRFSRVLATQDEALIAPFREEVNRILDEVEESRLL